MRNDDQIKIPPQSVPAEQSVLGNLIKYPYLLEEAVGQLSDIDFYRWDYREIFKCLKKLHGEGIKEYDLLSLSEILSKNENLGGDKVFSMLAELANTIYSEACFQLHIDIILDRSKNRQSLSMLSEVQNKIYGHEIGALDYLRNELTKIENQTSTEIITYSDILERTLEQIDIESNRETPLIGISSGWKSLDFYTNGFQPGQLIVIGARTSIGKSMFMLNMAEYIGINLLKPSIVFSLEMSDTELTKRTLSRFSRVKGIFTGKISSEDWYKIQDATNVIQNGKIFINDKGGITTSAIRTYCRKIRSREGKLGAVFVDYLGLMSGEGENETLKLGLITKELKILAKDLEVPIILLSQLNRESSKRADVSPKLFDLRQSGCIEQDADMVILLDRKIEDKKLMVDVAKQRNGMCGKFELLFNPDFFEFKEYGE